MGEYIQSIRAYIKKFWNKLPLLRKLVRFIKGNVSTYV